MQLNPAVKTKWLEALRSGQYQQVQHTCAKDGKYCANGLLVKIFYPKASAFNVDKLISLFTGTKNYTNAPAEQRLEWAENITLIRQMNDEGKSFVKIAEWIEQHL